MASKIAQAIAKEQAEKAEADWKKSVLARLDDLEKQIAELEAKLIELTEVPETEVPETEVPETKPTTRARKKSTD